MASFTSRDFELLVKAFKCSQSEFVIDNNKFAEACGFKNANSARVAWHGLRKKLDKIADGSIEVPSVTINDQGKSAGMTPASGKKRNAATEETDDPEEPAKTPSKTPKKARKTASTSKVSNGGSAANSDDEESKRTVKKEHSDGEEELAAPAPKTPAKKKGRKASPKKATASAAGDREAENAGTDEDAEQTMVKNEDIEDEP